MHFRTLGSEVEYNQAAKMLEQVANAAPNTPEALELKELMEAFIRYEKDILRINKSINQKQIDK
jgi:hypothetical protein